MHICIVFDKIIPVAKYGGIQRIVWWLGKELVNKGHKVTYLVGEGSTCHFADVKFYDKERDISEQIPESVDVVHSYIPIKSEVKKPYLIHMESNTKDEFHDINTVFVSKKHAERHSAQCYVYNGLDPEDYGTPDFKKKRNYVHFLAKAAWRVKNIKGAIKIAQKSKSHMHVLGGTRLNLHMGFRLTLDPRIHFHGMIGGDAKNKILNDSTGLIFPVVWHEPFGIAITESMYFGNPVFSTSYGSLPEIVNNESGVIANNVSDLAEAVKNRSDYNHKQIHERVMDCFTVSQMADKFLKLYEVILDGKTLNDKAPTYPQGETKFLHFDMK
ncbi:glycosyltransferase [Fulvivirga sp. RKSG066]|uniref:glycosyltransferase n=1 Tax=Fulvivirga aurantia TaxID=2529383 RepID=UPI0012BC70DE|nr:glycosyltransferase [Fulvivirga aurantia]MTI21977.1 glycosyltransferase [Fulvivirga aurantia]